MPSYQPTYIVDTVSLSSTTIASTSNGIPSTFVICLLSLPGILIFIFGTTALYFRSSKSEFLNPIHSIYIELGHIALKSGFVAVMVNKALINYGLELDLSFFLFVASRSWLIFLWFLILSDFWRHRKSNGVRLAQLLNYDLLSTGLDTAVFSTLAVLGLFDLTLLRLLPWKPTEFSKYVGGYPNLYSLRCIVYGSNIALLLQSLSSMFLLTRGESAVDAALSIVLVILSLFIMVQSLVGTIIGIQSERSSKMVTVFDMDRVLMKSVTTSRESLLRKLDRMSETRLSESDLVVNIENPLRYPSMFQPRQPENMFGEIRESNRLLRPSILVPRRTEMRMKGPVPDIEMVVKAPPPRAAAAVIEENSSGQYMSNVPFAEKTFSIMKSLLSEKGMDNVPVYIPLDQIKAELSTLMKEVNENRPFDEKRFDYLLLCMNYNEDYIKEKEEEARLWRDKLSAFSQECLLLQRGFTPPHIFSSSLTSLVKEDGLSELLAKRMMNKKCLWLVRVPAEDIDQLHEADLLGRSFHPLLIIVLFFLFLLCIT